MNSDHISLKLPLKEEGKSEEDEFTMYVMDLSYFSGKLECYFNYQVASSSCYSSSNLLTSHPHPASHGLDQKVPLAGSQVEERGAKLD